MKFYELEIEKYISLQKKSDMYIIDIDQAKEFTYYFPKFNFSKIVK